MQRSILVVAAGFGLAAALSAVDAQPAEGKMGLETLRAQRHEAAQRRRRIIFNNDGDDVIALRPGPVDPLPPLTGAASGVPVWSAASPHAAAGIRRSRPSRAGWTGVICEAA